MKCKHCGKELKDAWKLCPWCKTPVTKETPKCPNCGEEVDESWDICPMCEYPLKVDQTPAASTFSILPDIDSNVSVLPNVANAADILPDNFALDLVAGDIAEAKQREKDQADAEYKKKLDLARVYCIRKMFAEAKSIYDELIFQNFSDANAYIGLIRVVSQNYTILDNDQITEAIGIAQQIAREDLALLDSEYAAYEKTRKAHFDKIAKEKRLAEEAEAKRRAEEARAKAEAQRQAEAKAKRKAEEEFKKNWTIENGVLKKYNDNATNVVIPHGITGIGERAFEGKSLTSITIPDSVTSIGENAFFDCKNLNSITIPNSVTSIGEYAFYACDSLTRITIPSSVTSIGRAAFNARYLADILVAEDNPSYKSIDGNLYSKDGRTLVQYAVGRWIKAVFTIPSSVTNIGVGAFFKCSLESITIPNSVTNIGDCAFSTCSSLTSITIPDSVTVIGSYAFLRCSSLTSITIPNSVTRIGKDAFSYCSHLQTIYAPYRLDLSECRVPGGCKIIRR